MVLCVHLSSLSSYFLNFVFGDTSARQTALVGCSQDSVKRAAFPTIWEYCCRCGGQTTLEANRGFLIFALQKTNKKQTIQTIIVARNQLFRLFEHEERKKKTTWMPIADRLDPVLAEPSFWTRKQKRVCSFITLSSPQLLWNNSSQTLKC